MEYWADTNTSAGGEPVGGARLRAFPPVGLPSLGQLTWTKEAITVLVLLLALPWLLGKLLTNPGAVMSGVSKNV